MDEYDIVSLKDMIAEMEEGEIKCRLSSFSCPLNSDIEHFIHNKAIEFSKQNIAPTKLVYAHYQGRRVMCGYYTITLKAFTVMKKDVGANTFSRLKKFGSYNSDLEQCTIPAPLIAQLGKNFTEGYDKLISGTELLKLACDDIRAVQDIIGGKAVYIECENKKCLVDFYESSGFVAFGKRALDKDEMDKLNGRYLIQMLKYLK